MGVNEVCKRTGLTRRAMHYYEQRGFLGTVARRGGRRIYSEDQVRQLEEMAALVASGLRAEDAAAIASVGSDGAGGVTAARLVELISRALTGYERNSLATRLLVEALLIRVADVA